MRTRLVKLGAALAALAALAVGGSALASAAGGGGSQPVKPPAAVQPETPASEANEPAGKADTDSIQDENGKDDATEAKDNEADEANEPAESESGSEVPGDDGPGGHADEPGSPNADTQQQGEN